MNKEGSTMKSAFKKEILSLLKLFLLMLIIVFICQQFLFTPVAVKGESMSPTFENKDRLIIDKISSIDRFDVVVFHAPDVDKQYIKRVIGVPGDHIEMKDDVLYVNGDAYDEPYINKGNDHILYYKVTEDFTLENYTGQKVIPNGYYFVLGDNRWKSNDSRNFGLIPDESIIGKVQFRIFPLENMGIPD